SLPGPADDAAETADKPPAVREKPDYQMPDAPPAPPLNEAELPCTAGRSRRAMPGGATPPTGSGLLRGPPHCAGTMRTRPHQATPRSASEPHHTATVDENPVGVPEPRHSPWDAGPRPPRRVLPMEASRNVGCNCPWPGRCEPGRPAAPWHTTSAASAAARKRGS